MRIVEPVTIGDANFLASNIIEAIPLASSSTTISAWAVGTAYTAGNVVCRAYAFAPFAARFGVFTAKASSTGIDPNTDINDKGLFWTLGDNATLYDAAVSFGIYQVVGYIGSTTGAYYYSKIAANLAHTPDSSPTQWQQTTLTGFNSYAGGTTYASGDQVVVFTGQYAQVYQSLAGSNTGHTPASSPSWWSYLGATYKPWDSTTTYAAGNIVIDLRTHHSYESIAGSNINHDPTASTSSTYWIDLGTTNKWALFDLSNSSVTTCPTALDVTVQLPSSCNTLALLNMRATQVQVIASTAGAGTLYNVTINLTNQSNATASRLYYYDSATNEAHLLLLDLPTNTGLIVEIIVTNSGTTSQVGVALFGTYDTIGTSTYGATMGIISFSKKEADGFGNYTLLQRASSLRPKFTVVVDSSSGNADRVFFKLKRLDAVPALYVGADSRAASWAFGFYRSFEELLSYPTKSFYSLEIESLT